VLSTVAGSSSFSGQNEPLIPLRESIATVGSPQMQLLYSNTGKFLFYNRPKDDFKPTKKQIV
jgi:hypothetical protein